MHVCRVSCPFAHPGEKARRRCVRSIPYSANACPDMQKVRYQVLQLLHCWLLTATPVTLAIATVAVGAKLIVSLMLVQAGECPRGDACNMTHSVSDPTFVQGGMTKRVTTAMCRQRLAICHTCRTASSNRHCGPKHRMVWLAFTN
jgi:hypothetical protein